jgi:hypothetical protein
VLEPVNREAGEHGGEHDSAEENRLGERSLMCEGREMHERCERCEQDVRGV